MQRINMNDISEGDEVIVEVHHWDYKTGAPKESTFYRTYAEWDKYGYKLRHEPTVDFPLIPKWQLGWIPAGNTKQIQMWRRP